MTRSIAAILAGLVGIIAVLLAVDAMVPILLPGAFSGPDGGGAVGVLLLTVAYVAAATMLGGYITARVAPSRPARHALVLGVLVLGLVVTGTAVAWASAPVWYHALSLAFVLPFVWLGGYLRTRASIG